MQSKFVNFTQDQVSVIADIKKLKKHHGSSASTWKEISFLREASETNEKEMKTKKEIQEAIRKMKEIQKMIAKMTQHLILQLFLSERPAQLTFGCSPILIRLRNAMFSIIIDEMFRK